MWNEMDTMTKSDGSEEAGRRRGRSGRKSYTLEEKCRIVEATQVTGASVSKIAREHDINTNLIFTWRRQHARGELVASHRPRHPVALLPICVEADVRKTGSELASTGEAPKSGLIEIDLLGGSVRIHGRVEPDALRQVLDALQHR